jgi:alcohol dehydrogenase
MSDYGFLPEESMTLAKGARSMQGGLFLANPCEMTDEDCASIFDKSYR